MASPTLWTGVWVSSRSWWWTGKPGVLQSTGLQSRTQLSNWTEQNYVKYKSQFNINQRKVETINVILIKKKFCVKHLLSSHSVMSNSLWSHELQHTRPPCPSPVPGVYSNLCPLSWWCHPTVSSSVIPFSSCLQSFPASGSFLMGRLLASGGQSIGASASASVLPMNTQDWSPLGWTGWVSLQSKGLWRVFSNSTVQKHQFFGTQLSSQSNSHIHTWPLEKP